MNLQNHVCKNLIKRKGATLRVKTGTVTRQLSGSRCRLYTCVPLTRRGGPIRTDRNGMARQDGGGTPASGSLGPSM